MGHGLSAIVSKDLRNWMEKMLFNRFKAIEEAS